jgi:hypothetical protein
LLWVSQANQPAKALDKAFYEQWAGFFAENLARKRPPVVLVTTHNDRLVPAEGWSPPYDLTQLDDPVVRVMRDALEYCHEAIGLAVDNRGVPVSLVPDQTPFNVKVLHDLLLAASDEARAVQLNRQRLDGDGAMQSVRKAIGQAAGLLKVGVDLTLK